MPALFPDSEFTAAWRNVILYDEHTWGAHNSVSEPDLPFVKDQWAIKRRFALDADSLSKLLLRQALPEAQQINEERSFDIYNTLSWPRTDIVYLTAEESSAGDLVVGGDGNMFPTQRLSTGALAVMVKDIPPMSARRISVQKGRAVAQGSARREGNTLENGALSLTISRATGAIDALQWKRNGLQLVDAVRGAGLNEYIYVPGKDPADARRLSNVKVTGGESGKLVSSLVVTADAPGCKSYFHEVRVLDGIDRIDIINGINREAVRAKEGVHLAFPFSVPDGQLRYDVAHGIVRPEGDQLPGACKNFFSVVSWVDVSNDQRGVTWATIDAPLIEIGDITAEQPWMKEIAPAQNFYSYVMNNYWHTNYKADQEGEVLFRYAVRPHGVYSQVEAARFGIERRQPLLVLPPSGVGTLEGSLYELESGGVLVLSTKPIATGGGWILYLYNPTPEAQQARLKWNKNIPVSINASDSFGRTGELIEGSFVIPASGSVYVRVNPK
jgi:hypothetical protein